MIHEELIAKLEAAEGPSRELDAEIALAVGVVPDGAFRPCASMDPGTFGTGAYDFWTAPHYTASVDAALSLLPEGWDWVIHCYAKKPCATIGPRRAPDGAVAQGATPALALTIAALKARVEQEGR